MVWRAGVVVAAIALSTASQAREYTEQLFFAKPSGGHPAMAVPGTEVGKSRTLIGSSRFYQAQKKDTFLDVARYYDLGYNEFEEANPGVDPWVPPAGEVLLLPTEFVLPDASYVGIVVNIPEMRLYYYRPAARGQVMVTTFPVGLGRDDWRTPSGKFKVIEKTENPRWVLPESIREEHRKDGRPAPEFIAGGDPENPLGKYRLRLTLPLYGIHGTNIPWGVGMQVSHGCVRLYPEDIGRLFPMVPVGTPGEFVYQPIKLGTRDGRIFIEVHKDIYDQLPGMYREAVRILDKYGWRRIADLHRLEQAVLDQSGVPVDITRDAEVAADEDGSRSDGRAPIDVVPTGLR
jgi:L,D-transpeptidase ErfK/SrfK